jgi:hypothetical protein
MSSFNGTAYRGWRAENCRTIASCSPECVFGNRFRFVNICFTVEKFSDDFDANTTKICPFLIEAIPCLVEVMSNLKRSKKETTYQREYLVVEADMVDRIWVDDIDYFLNSFDQIGIDYKWIR